MQHIASIGDSGHAKGWRFVRYLLSNPLWLLGWIALAGAFVFQALALHNGQMSVVQPLLVTELVFGLVLRRLWIHQQIRASWAAALTAGRALFVAMSEPTGGNAEPTSSRLGRRHRRHGWGGGDAGSGRAARLAGSPGGGTGRRDVDPVPALVATFIKATTDTLAQFGPAGMFTHWPVYRWRWPAPPPSSSTRPRCMSGRSAFRSRSS